MIDAMYLWFHLGPVSSLSSYVVNVVIIANSCHRCCAWVIRIWHFRISAFFVNDLIFFFFFFVMAESSFDQKYRETDTRGGR